MEIGIRIEETAKWKQDRENRNEELGIKSNSGIEGLGPQINADYLISHRPIAVPSAGTTPVPS